MDDAISCFLAGSTTASLDCIITTDDRKSNRPPDEEGKWHVESHSAVVGTIIRGCTTLLFARTRDWKPISSKRRAESTAGLRQNGCWNRPVVPVALWSKWPGRGYHITGFDLNRPSLDYLRRRLARRRLRADVFEADMADFRLSRPVDAAFCTVNTFRHLLTERSARQHLNCVAQSLRPGGIYILGLHLLPMDASEEDSERWTAREGRTQVTVTLRVLSTDRRRRIERLRMSLLARTAGKELRLRRRACLSPVYGPPVPTAAGRCAVAGTLRRLRLLVRDRQSPATERRSGGHRVCLAKASQLSCGCLDAGPRRPSTDRLNSSTIVRLRAKIETS